MKFKKEMLALYAVTDGGRAGEPPLYRQIEATLKGGATMIQLREKDLSARRFLEEASLICELCRRFGVPLIINDDLDVALKSGADGVHLGAEDLPVAEARRLAGPDFIIGATAKTEAQALAAQEAGADYLGVGAVFPSPTKTDAIRITPEKLKAICAAVSIPVAAIGGINENNIAQLSGSGAAGVAVISALFRAPDVEARAAALKEKAKEALAL